MRLNQQVAIVTGGASGFGEENCRQYAAQGARVVVADINVALGEKIAANLTAGAADRNWKRAPSPMDRVKGRTAGGRAWSGGRPRESARSGPK